MNLGIFDSVAFPFASSVDGNEIKITTTDSIESNAKLLGSIIFYAYVLNYLKLCLNSPKFLAIIVLK
jgi:hypothetical protein